MLLETHGGCSLNIMDRVKASHLYEILCNLEIFVLQLKSVEELDKLLHRRGGESLHLDLFFVFFLEVTRHCSL